MFLSLQIGEVEGMRRGEWWKIFALGIELDVAGTFIYNGLDHLNKVEHFYHLVDTFEILYNLSVGIERVVKIAILLCEHNDEDAVEALEKSLITHNTQALID